MPTLTPSSEDTRIYEFCVLLPFPLNQKEEQVAMKEVEELFDAVDAKQISKDYWGRRGLAYTIEGYDEGNFVIYYYEMDPSKVKEVDQNLRILKTVLRHLVVKPPKGYEVIEYSKQFEQWKKDQVNEEQAASQRREEELKKKMLKKQQRAGAKRKTDDQPKAKADDANIGEGIDKLIADDELEL